MPFFTKSHSHENKNHQYLKNQHNAFNTFDTTEVDVNKFKFKQIKNIYFVPSTVLHACGKGMYEKDTIYAKETGSRANMMDIDPKFDTIPSSRQWVF